MDVLEPEMDETPTTSEISPSHSEHAEQVAMLQKRLSEAGHHITELTIELEASKAERVPEAVPIAAEQSRPVIGRGSANMSPLAPIRSPSSPHNTDSALSPPVGGEQSPIVGGEQSPIDMGEPSPATEQSPTLITGVFFRAVDSPEMVKPSAKSCRRAKSCPRLPVQENCLQLT
jgi:hypothetical protein